MSFFLNRPLHAARLPVLLAAILFSSRTPAQEKPVAPATDDPPERRVYVPVEDLDVVFERDKQGVILPRDEFLKLYAAAKKNSDAAPHLPRGVALSQADYIARQQDDQLVISATIEFTQFTPGWHAITLPFRGVAVESATLDDKPAQLGRAAPSAAKPQAAPQAQPQQAAQAPTPPAKPPAPALVLFANEPGKHTLKLELSANLVTVGSDRAAAFSLPPIGSASLRMTLPAGKYLNLNELPLERPAAADKPAEYILAIGGKRDLSLRITDKQAEQATAALVFASTAIGVHVAPEELTWRAVSSLQVFGQPIDALEFSIPKTLDIVSVESTGLERWEIALGPNAGTTLLKLTWRQAFQESRSITFQGVSSTVIGQPWAVPTLTLSRATSHVARVVVQHPPGLRLQVIETTGVRRITPEELPAANVPDMGKAAVDPTQTLHFAAWQADFSLLFVTQPKARELQATIATRLDVDSRELVLRSSIGVQSRFAPLFDLDLTLPAEWTVTDVLVSDKPAVWRAVPVDVGLHRVRIQFNPPIPIDGTAALTLVARHIPGENWPVEATPVAIKLPEVHLPQAGVTEGTYLLAAEDDLDIVPEELTGLDPAWLPAGQQQVARPPRLVYEYQDTRFTGRLSISRKPARIAAHTLAFHRLDRETLASHLEARLAIAGGGVRTLQVALSESAGIDLRFRLGPTDVRIVEQTSAPPADGERVWTLQFDQRAHGNLSLSVELETPRASRRQPDVSLALPALRLVAAEREEGHVAIEAGPDQQLAITATDAASQRFSEIDPPDMPQPIGYAPRERIVSAYHTVRPGAQIALAETRFDRIAVPTAVCDKAELTSILGQTGEFQHRADFTLRAVGVQGLRVQLPDGATLWATLLDGQPIEVRKVGQASQPAREGSPQSAPPNGYSVPLPPVEQPDAPRTLQLFYRTTLPALAAAGTLHQQPPRLAVVNSPGEVQPLEILERSWTLHHPPETEITDANGLFEPVQKPSRQSFLGDLQHNITIGTRDELLHKGMVTLGAIAVIGVFTLAYRRRARAGVVMVASFGIIVALALILLPVTSSSFRNARNPLSLEEESAKVYSEAARRDDRTRIHGIGGGLGGMAPGDPAALIDSPAAVAEMPPPPNAPPTAMPSLAEPEAAKPQAKELPKERDAASKESGIFSGGRGKQPLAGKARFDELTRLIEATTKPDTSEAVGGPGAMAQFDTKLSLVIRQTQELQDGGLLSLSMELDPPAESRTTQFKYVGSTAGEEGPELVVEYQNRRALSFVAIALQVGVLLVFWFARRGSAGVRAALGALGLAVPLALIPLVPLAVLPYLDALFLGTVFGLALWLALAVGSPLNRMVRRGFRSAPHHAATAGLIIVAVLTSGAGNPFSGEPEASTGVAAGIRHARSATHGLAAGSPLNEALVAWAEEAQPSAAQPTLPPEPKRKPTFVIPYQPGDDPLQAGRVFLPYDKFLELWNAANPEKRKEGLAPVEGLVAEALFVAKPLAQRAKPQAAGKMQIGVTGRIVVHSFRDEQITLPLPLGAVALSSALLDGKPAPIVSRETEGTRELAIVIATRGVHVVDLQFALPAEQTGPAGKFTLPVKSVPAGSLRFTLPAKDLAVKVNGASGVFRQTKDGDETVVVVPLGEGGDLTLSWTPSQAREVAQGIVHVDAATAVLLDDAGLRLSMRFAFTVRQGTLSEVTFALPPGLLVRQISGLDLGGWEAAGDADKRTLKVFLRRPVSDGTSLEFDLYLPQKFTEESQPVTVPQFAPTGVTRETGLVGVFSEKQFAITPGATSGLSQIDISQFAGGPDRHGPALYAYRYAARPFQLQLLVARQKPQSNGTAEHGLLVGPRKVRVSSRLELLLAGAPRSDITVQLPAGYLLYDLQSADAADYHVETRSADGPNKPPSLLHVELAGPRTGLVTLILDGIVPREPADLAVKVAVPVPLGMSELRTSLAVWLDRAYSGTLQDLVGWKSIDPAQLPPRVTSLRAIPVQFAFTSTGTLPQPIGIALARAVPRLTADSLTAIVARETSVQYVLSLQWNIALAEESRFVFTTPDWLAGRLDFSGNKAGARIRQVTSEKIAGNRIRWILTLEEPQSERYFVTARAILPPPATRIEAPAIVFETAGVPALAGAGQPPQGGTTNGGTPMESQHHHLLLVNQSPFQLDLPAADLVEPVAADDLPIKVSKQLTDQAAEIVRVRDPKAAVAWLVRSLEALRSLRASVNLAEMTLVVSRDGTWRGQADFRINNRSRQFLALQMPAGSTVLSLFVAGRPSRPVHTQRNGQEVLLVPLPKTAEGDLSAEVRLVSSGRFAKPLPRGVQVLRSQLDLPAPRVLTPAEDAEFGIDVARTSWTVHLPEDIDAAPVDDPDRTNVTQSVEGYDRLIAEMNEALDLANSLTIGSIASSRNDAQRTRAMNNLKKLNVNILKRNLDPYSGTTAAAIVEAQGANELRDLSGKWQAAQQQLQAQPGDQSAPGQPAGGQQPIAPASSKDIETQLQAANPYWEGERYGKAPVRAAEEEFRFKGDAKPQAAAGAGKPGEGKPPAKSAPANRAELRSQSESQAQALNTAPQLDDAKRELSSKQLRQERAAAVTAAPDVAQPKPGQADFDDLTQFVIQTIQPETWDEVGGVANPGRGGGIGGMGFGGMGGMAGQDNTAAGWTTVGGLSLAIELPKTGQKLTFSKIGGDPKLAVGLRPRASLETGIGLIWTLVWLAIGCGLAAALGRASAAAALRRQLPVILIAVGLVWFFVLPAALAGFAFFVLGAIAFAWQHRAAEPRTNSASRAA